MKPFVELTGLIALHHGLRQPGQMRLGLVMATGMDQRCDI